MLCSDATQVSQQNGRENTRILKVIEDGFSMTFFLDREQAGRLLGEVLLAREFDHPVILALPRGGVPVALEIAKMLKAPLDLQFVRKISVPGQPELAAGAVVDGNPPLIILNDSIVNAVGIRQEYIENEATKKLAEIARRRSVYLADRETINVLGRTVILTDDGIATGATVRAALKALRHQKPSKLILAIPVAASDTLAKIESEVDEIICLKTPHPFIAIGAHYNQFDQLEDWQVMAMIKEADGIESE